MCVYSAPIKRNQCFKTAHPRQCVGWCDLPAYCLSGSSPEGERNPMLRIRGMQARPCSKGITHGEGLLFSAMLVIGASSTAPLNCALPAAFAAASWQASVTLRAMAPPIEAPTRKQGILGCCWVAHSVRSTPGHSADRQISVNNCFFGLQCQRTSSAPGAKLQCNSIQLIRQLPSPVICEGSPM